MQPRLDARKFVDALVELGFTLGSGVPCSWLNSLTNEMLNRRDVRYVMAAQEGEAVAIAAGADLAGQRALVTLQGSGLTNAGSPLTSYNYPFRRGLLLFVSWRGEPGVPDEPQHELMGEITEAQLDLWRIPHQRLASELPDAISQLHGALRHLDAGRSFAFVVRRGMFTDVVLTARQSPISRERPSRRAALTALLAYRDQGTMLLATTGYTGRELFELGDSPNQLYMVGSMGCVSSLALGLALAQPQRRFIAIDGDGALLMRLGSLATNAWAAPPNLLHVVLDNGGHESTGGQATAAGVVDFPALAWAAGYPRSVGASDLAGFDEAVADWHRAPQLTFLHLETAMATGALGRPTVTPAEVAARLRNYLTVSEPVQAR
ncbi:MAG TPA: phosphonopyruvate decarboxylase [Candidatus Andersenbacteria bacterium]|nr:MAG: phosphonopyruvate decarboxylase [Parcubacteria group bacterium RIFCSPHIGHO2_01_FULL_56_18]HLD25505.1 phosphonopyruvate decarboxylase [Candidatus Andersenbacteria bacterium]